MRLPLLSDRRREGAQRYLYERSSSSALSCGRRARGRSWSDRHGLEFKSISLATRFTRDATVVHFLQHSLYFGYFVGAAIQSDRLGGGRTGARTNERTQLAIIIRPMQGS